MSLKKRQPTKYSNKLTPKKSMILMGVLVLSISGCGTTYTQKPTPEILDISEEPEPTSSLDSQSSKTSSSDLPVRDNTPVCLVPEASGVLTESNDVAIIDFSNSSEGYIGAIYTGDVKKIKLRVTGTDGIVYTYDLHPGAYEFFPLTSGDGPYDISIYENIQGTSYSTCLYAQIDVAISDEFKPYLYPNQYVNFTKDSKVVQKASELSLNCYDDLDVITSIYDYITSNIVYNYELASDPPTGYTTDVDSILESGTGICLDYSAVMASMLRSQRIPTRLDIGYAQDAYHAWISIYTPETGWLNDIIEFDGKKWTLVDPTFGASTEKKALRKWIGDGTNYTLEKTY